MSKTRPFSIFLLKQGFNADNTLVDDSPLDKINNARSLPADAHLYVLDTAPTSPWWRSFFGIQQNLMQVTKGALVFLPVGDRWFALSFGYVFHNLKANSYEYDFGLKVTLNSLDPKKLKSADVLDPGAAIRRRTQVPSAADLTLLDFDGNAEIVRSLTGKVKEELSELFKSATGSASLKIGLKVEPDQLKGICETLLDLYESEDYLVTFPNVRKIVPEKDPDVVSRLNAALVEAFIDRSDDLCLSIPDIVDYRDNICFKFQGRGGLSEIYADLSLESFYDYLGDEYNYNDLSFEKLKSFVVALCDADGNVSKGFSLYSSLLFDVAEAGEIFHLCEGNWYRADLEYIESMEAYLDSKYEATSLPSYNHDRYRDGVLCYSEEAYNEAVPNADGSYICLDQTDIAPQGYTQIEPCDLYVVDAAHANAPSVATMYHIKISTRSGQLSHLFNQGANSAALLITEAECREALKRVVRERIGGNSDDMYCDPIDHKRLKVVLAVITRKPAVDLSRNFPLFSKISLMRCLKDLERMQVPGVFTFIPDSSAPKEKYSQYLSVVCEIAQSDSGELEVVVSDGQQIAAGTRMKKCSAGMKDLPVGSKWRIYYKLDKTQMPYTNRTWQYESADV